MILLKNLIFSDSCNESTNLCRLNSRCSVFFVIPVSLLHLCNLYVLSGTI